MSTAHATRRRPPSDRQRQTSDRGGRLGRPTRTATLAGAPHRRALAVTDGLEFRVGGGGLRPRGTLSRRVRGQAGTQSRCTSERDSRFGTVRSQSCALGSTRELLTSAVEWRELLDASGRATALGTRKPRAATIEDCRNVGGEQQRLHALEPLRELVLLVAALRTREVVLPAAPCESGRLRPALDGVQLRRMRQTGIRDHAGPGGANTGHHGLLAAFPVERCRPAARAPDRIRWPSTSIIEWLRAARLGRERRPASTRGCG